MILTQPWVIVGIVLATVIALAILSRISTGVGQPVSKEVIKQTDVLLKAANKWATMAKQDTNLIMSLMHICYAKAYVETLRRVLNDTQISQAHQVDMRDLEEKMDVLEQSILAKIAQKAPALMPDGEFAVRTGWLG